MDASRFLRRWIVAPLLAIPLALATSPTGAFAQADVAVTVNDPAGTRVVTTAQLARWTKITRRFDDADLPLRTVRANALQLLTQAQWMEAEAIVRGITVSDEKVQKEVEDLLNPDGELADFGQAIRQTGMTREEFTFLMRISNLYLAVYEQEIERVRSAVTDRAIDAYIKQHGPMRLPETRDVRILRIATRAQADRARWALDHGATWSQVAFDYSIGKSRGSARVRKRMPKEAFEGGVSSAVFRADVGALAGPIESRKHYVVFKVVRVRPGSVLPRAKHRALVRELLAAEAAEQTLEAFSTGFRATWKARTVCAPAYVWYQDCTNWDGTKIKGLEDGLSMR